MSAKKIQIIQVFALVVSLFMTILATASLAVQVARDTITGKVLDAQKAIVPDATVIVTNVAMGTNTTVKTNEDGLFRALYLIPGTYQISVSLQGFKKYIRDGVMLRVGDTLALDIQLEIGAIDQSVTVVADAPLLETATA